MQTQDNHQKDEGFSRSQRTMRYTDQVMRSLTEAELQCAPLQAALVTEFFTAASHCLVGLPVCDRRALTFLLSEQLQALLFNFEMYVHHWRLLNRLSEHPSAMRDIRERVAKIGSFGDSERLFSLITREREYFA